VKTLPLKSNSIKSNKIKSAVGMVPLKRQSPEKIVRTIDSKPMILCANVKVLSPMRSFCREVSFSISDATVPMKSLLSV
jgi:hypothetical protein